MGEVPLYRGANQRWGLISHATARAIFVTLARSAGLEGARRSFLFLNPKAYSRTILNQCFLPKSPHFHAK